MLLICIATSICALIFNGVMSIVLLPPTLVVYHIMLSPYRALWLSIGTILLMIPIGGYFFDSESYRLLVRFIIGAIITLVIMQTLMRYISRTNHVSMTVTDNLSKLALQLDEELLQLEAALVGAEHGDGHVGRGKVDDGGLFLAHAGTAGEDDVQRVGTSSRMNSGEEGTIGVSK